jgi:hypothetical protein
MKEFVMHDVLDERLIVTLVALQPRKEVVSANYAATFQAGSGPCYSQGCVGGCKTNGCKGTIRQKKK